TWQTIAMRKAPVWSRLVLQGPFRPSGSFVIAARTGAAERRGSLPMIHLGIEGTEAHGSRDVLDRRIRIAIVDLDPAASGPGDGEVRIEGDGAIDASSAVVELAQHVAQRQSALNQRDGIISPELDRASRQPLRLGRLLLAIDHPAVHLAVAVEGRGHGIRRRKVRIALDGLYEQSQSGVVRLPRRAMGKSQPAQVAIIV